VPVGEALKGWERVLIKVNFITTKSWESGATTDPLVVEALVHRLRELGKEVLVVESDAQMTNADKAWEASGVKEVCQRLEVPFVNMRRAEKAEVEVAGGLALRRVKVAKLALESGRVSAAKLKTHSETKVTLGLKNMFGMLTAKHKFRFHLMGIEKVIRDVNTVVPPHLTVIDGFVGMEGKGPVHGRPVKMDTVIAGVDPVATDAVAARAMGFEPGEVEHIRLCREAGVGDYEEVLVVGDGLEAVRRVFARA